MKKVRCHIIILHTVLVSMSMLCAHTLMAQDNGDTLRGPTSIAKNLLKMSDFKGGLCVHLACGDGQITAELGAMGKFIVQGLEHDERLASKARAHILEQGVYGRISLWQQSYQQLPYADNLVNVVIVTNTKRVVEGGLNFREVFRVLCPDGRIVIGPITAPLRTEEITAMLRESGFIQIAGSPEKPSWYTARKPIPPELDEWTHARHGPDGNKVSTDTVVAPPNDLRWLTGNKYSDPVGNPMLSAGGRFYTGNKNGLTARDAYNGILLWTQPHVQMRSSIRSGDEIPLVVSDTHLYAVQNKKGEQPKLVALDATTGAVVKTYDGLSDPQQILLHQESLVVQQSGSIICMDKKTGGIKWRFSGGDAGMLIGKDSVFYFNSRNKKNTSGGTYGALDFATGKKRWENDIDTSWPLSIKDPVSPTYLTTFQSGYLVFTQPKQKRIIVIQSTDGKYLWHRDDIFGHDAKDFYFVDGLLWMGVRETSSKTLTSTLVGVNPKTGGIIKTFPVPRTRTRCYPRNATTQYKFYGDFDSIGFNSGVFSFFPSARGGCGVGFLPANGLLYGPPSNHCACGTFLSGTFAVEANDVLKWQTPDTERHEKGPAWNAPPSDTIPTKNDWPHYRHDAQRSASTPCLAPKHLTPLWDLFVGDGITACTVANGLVFAAASEAHTVSAFDTETGTRHWQFIAGGRVDSPPTIYKGYCLFGARDGWVYCLRADNGNLVWRHQAAPGKRLIVCDGQLESAWPVHGSVIIENDRVYFAAGRNSGLKGGIWVNSVVPETGEPIWQHQIRRGAPGPKYNTPIDCTLLTSNGKSVFMGHWRRDIVRMATDNGLASKTKTHDGLLVGTRFNLIDEIKRESRVSTWGYKGTDGMLMAFDAKRIVSINSITKRKVTTYIMSLKNKDAEGDNKWSHPLSMTPKAVLLTKEFIFVAGIHNDKKGAENILHVYAANTGDIIQSVSLASAPAWDGMTLASRQLYITTQNGYLYCFGEKKVSAH